MKRYILMIGKGAKQVMSALAKDTNIWRPIPFKSYKELLASPSWEEAKKHKEKCFVLDLEWARRATGEDGAWMADYAAEKAELRDLADAKQLAHECGIAYHTISWWEVQL